MTTNEITTLRSKAMQIDQYLCNYEHLVSENKHKMTSAEIVNLQNTSKKIDEIINLIRSNTTKVSKRHN